jgi:hypothetical protein
MIVEAKKGDDKYIVTPTGNYNATVNETKAVSFWKYEVSTDGVNGLIIHDGGSSSIGIAFCPWCGSTL